MDIQESAVRILDTSLKDRGYAMELSANPAAIFRRDAGMEIPTSEDEKFKTYFEEIVLGLGDERSISCTACKAATYTIAGMILALGVVGLAALGETSPVVVTLARFLGRFGSFEIAAVLRFIKGLAPVLSLGLGALAGEICRYARAC